MAAPIPFHRRSLAADTGRPALNSPARFLVLLVLLIFAAEIGAILSLNEGVFVYTLDDPYIHLQLAWNILHGHYGMNPAQVAAPSSSILWPLLLAPFAGLPAAQFVPLLLNLVFTIASVMAAFRIIRSSINDELIAFLLGAGFLVATNLVGIALTGMEHSLQTLLSICLLAGILQEQRSGACPRWIWPVILIGPLVRYENLVLSLPALAYLAWRGRVRPALVTALLLVGLLGAFSAFLYSLGLDLLPSSILAKNTIVSGSPDAFVLFANLAENLHYPGIPAFLIAYLLLAWKLVRPRRPAERHLALLLLAGETGYLILGRFGWFARYEIFLLTVLLLGLVDLYASPHKGHNPLEPAPIPAHPSGIRRLQLWRMSAAVLLPLALFTVFSQYLLPTFYSPQASHNIYAQQYQMRRFAQDFYRAPVAVNDLGLVSYQNPHPVLDLWGLGSHTALRCRSEGAGPGWMDRLAGEQGVRLAMIYRDWFPELPARWITLADLTLSGPRFTVGGSTVTFYAIDPSACPAIRQALIEFRPTLPVGASLDIYNCPDGEELSEYSKRIISVMLQ